MRELYGVKLKQETKAGYGQTSWKQLNEFSPFLMPPRRRKPSILAHRFPL